MLQLCNELISRIGDGEITEAGHDLEWTPPWMCNAAVRVRVADAVDAPPLRICGVCVIAVLAAALCVCVC